MITLNCDNCEKSFEVESAEAGGKVPCPYCGDINRVPVAKPAPEAKSTAPAPRPMPAEAREVRDEKKIAVIRPAMFRAHPFRYLAILLIVAGGLALVIWDLVEDRPAVNWLLWPGLILIVIGVIWWVAWWVRANRWIKVVISNKRTIREEGIIRRHTTEVLHDHVRSVDINQTFLQRILNVGYIGVDSAGQDGIEIQVRDIPGPHRVKAIIDQYRRM